VTTVPFANAVFSTVPFTVASANTRRFAIFCQQFPPSLLTQVLQHVPLRAELLGTSADAGLLDLCQPLGSLTAIIDISSSTGNGLAAVIT